MDEIRENPNKSGLNELERIFHEYKEKLVYAEKEASEITGSAWKKAEKLIEDKQKEAQQIADDINQKAQQDVDRIIWEAKSKASEIEREATDTAKKEAKERTRKEAESIIASVRKMAEKEAEEIRNRAQKEAEAAIKNGQESARLQIFKEAESIVAEAKQRAKKVDEDSIARAKETSKLIIEASHKAYEIVSQMTEQAQRELNDLVSKFDTATDELELRSILENADTVASNNKTDDSSKVQGWRELNILSPYDIKQIKRLLESLKQIPSIKLEGQSGSEEDYSIYLNIAEPIPLQDILQELSIVENSDVRGKKIKLQLKNLDE